MVALRSHGIVLLLVTCMLGMWVTRASAQQGSAPAAATSDLTGEWQLDPAHSDAPPQGGGGGGGGYGGHSHGGGGSAGGFGGHGGGHGGGGGWGGHGGEASNTSSETLKPGPRKPFGCHPVASSIARSARLSSSSSRSGG